MLVGICKKRNELDPDQSQLFATVYTYIYIYIERERVSLMFLLPALALFSASSKKVVF